MKNIADVLDALAQGIRAEETAGRHFQSAVMIFVDQSGQWAATAAGIELPDLMELLQRARDDAVLGGKGYSVIDEKPPLKLVVP